MPNDIRRTPSQPRRPSGRLVLVMALISGLVVANSYYAQPIVGLIADDLHASTTNVGLVVTASQIGYAVGLALLVPLGDLVRRKILLWCLLAATAVCLAVMAFAPWWQLLASAALLVGIGSVVGQIVVPLAASLAAPDERGRVIGNVMTGLLLGILLSRVVAGLIAEVAGWRAVFGTAVVFMLIAGCLVGALPSTSESTDVSYRELLVSVVQLVREESVLRWRIAYGMLTYASFGVMWTSIGFLLAGPGYHWTDAQIGLFTFTGVAGALAAKGAGALADRGYAHIQTGVLLAVTAASFILLARGERDVIALGFGVAILDLGIQGTHITNQSQFYPLRPDARSRLNTAYMTTYFAAGSLGSVASVFVYAHDGWAGVCVLGALFPTVGFGVWLAESWRHRSRRGAAEADDRRNVSSGSAPAYTGPRRRRRCTRPAPW